MKCESDPVWERFEGNCDCEDKTELWAKENRQPPGTGEKQGKGLSPEPPDPDITLTITCFLLSETHTDFWPPKL